MSDNRDWKSHIDWDSSDLLNTNKNELDHQSQFTKYYMYKEFKSNWSA